MTELELLRELADETPLPDFGELAHSRTRLLTAIETERRHDGRRWRAQLNQPRRRVRPRRRLIVGGLACGAAAAVMLGALNGVTTHSDSARVQSVAVAPGERLPVLVHPTAVQLLERAAFVTLEINAAAPRGDQFVYVKTETGDGQIGQSWLSVNGTRQSLIYEPGESVPRRLPGCVNGHSSQRTLGKDGKPLNDFIPKSFLARHSHQPITFGEIAKRFFGGKLPTDGPIVTTRCTPQPAFFPQMPTTVNAMRTYLVKTHVVYPAGVVTPAVNLNDLAKDIGLLLDNSYLLPAQQAALYKLLAQTPGITVKPGVTDAAGRPGIGIEWSFEGTRQMLIFSSKTYTYLGWSLLGRQSKSGSTALLAEAIVTTSSQLPKQSATTRTTSNA